MARIIFGVWDHEVIDNRNKHLFEIDEIKEFEPMDEFSPGNPLKAFVGWKGFFIFDASVNIVDIARQYMEKAVEESCGKCTPCRVGNKIILNKLENICNGNGTFQDLLEIEKLAHFVKDTSLCELGQTSTVALSYMLEYFSDEFEKAIKNKEPIERHPSHSYVTAPCIEACPARVDVPSYIDFLKRGKTELSVATVLEKYPLAAVCGRVCVRFCEMACRRQFIDEPLSIKHLKRFIADQEKYVTNGWFNKKTVKEKKPKDLKIAVVGAGPAGISCAYHLLLKGYKTEIFEAMTEPGGMAAVGIPEYRLPKEILRKEVSIVENLGGTIHYNKRMGTDFDLQHLIDKGFKAIFIGIGTHSPRPLGIKGEDRHLKGYKSGVKFLLYVNHYYVPMGISVDLGERAVVVGGGNVAMDCARTALRMGFKEVHLVYRRTRSEMPADPEEIKAAEEEGIIFHFLTNPTEIISKDGKVTAIKLVKMQLTEPDESGRRRPIPIEGSEFILETDMIIPAIGQQIDLSFMEGRTDLELTAKGTIKVNSETLQTSKKNVFAGGDCARGPATLIEAMTDGMKAADSIDQYLTTGKIIVADEERMSKLVGFVKQYDKTEFTVPVKKKHRIMIEELDPDTRKCRFDEVEKPLSPEDAYLEADRCLRCYRISLAVTER